jgi:hypothetical protein
MAALLRPKASRNVSTQNFKLTKSKADSSRHGTLKSLPAAGCKERREKMETFRNMEVVLMLCFGLVCAAACLERTAVPASSYSAEARASPPAEMAVVVVVGKRPNGAGKRALAGDARTG